MIPRLLNPLTNHSFLLFGARGTGKSCLLRELFREQIVLNVDLLDPGEFSSLNVSPGELSARISSFKRTSHGSGPKWVVIDEIQKIPKLLDLVHWHIENSKGQLLFAITGSSARKLKRGAANLLAGRALVYHLFPFTARELGDAFDLDQALAWGTLPEVFNTNEDLLKRKILQAYAHTYLREEVQAEQLIRALDPFHLFLKIAAQMSGKIINFSKIAVEAGTSDKSVKEYFRILEDTLLGFFLPPFHRSIRKRQRQQPKFYFIDLGIERSLALLLQQSVLPRTSYYGELFEKWLIAEIYKMCHYLDNDFSLSYLRTKDGAEIDLIIERPGMPTALIEIKSSSQISEADTLPLAKLAGDLTNVECFCLSQDPFPKVYGIVNTLPWREGLKAIGLWIE